MPPAPRRLVRKLAEYTAALVVALVLAEVGARMFLRLPPRVQSPPLGLKEAVDEAAAPGLGEWLVRDGEATARYPELDADGPDGPEGRARAREVRYRTSRDGFRDRPFERERAPGSYRIAVLGDSVAFGFGIDEADTLPRLLEERLRARFGDRVEVMNCGIYSFNATQQAAHLRHRVADFAPDLALFVTTVTDASGRGIELAGGKNEGWELRCCKVLGLTSGRFAPSAELPPAQRRMLALRRRSALADFLANRAYSWLQGRVMAAGYLQDWEPGTPGRAAVAAAYADAHRLARERGFELHVALYPVLDRLDAYPLEPVHAAVAELCAEEGLVFHDLLPALEGLNARALHAHAHDKHPNGRANRLVADLLARELEPVVAGGLGE